MSFLGELLQNLNNLSGVFSTLCVRSSVRCMSLYSSVAARVNQMKIHSLRREAVLTEKIFRLDKEKSADNPRTDYQGL